jgi:peptidoglycan hydrolase-like protein with peptidoglycan-binding domain
MTNTRPWSTEGPGATGPSVTGIQYLLRARGHAISADGVYGPQTAAAVEAVQTAAGVAVDGVVGPQTWPELVVTTSSGSTGDAVRAVQQFGLVPSPGVDPLVVDGSYGPITTERVRFFQESWGLGIDGAAGPETWSFLTSGRGAWPLVKQGATQASNWRVLAAQHLLRAHGATITADGVFGPASGAAAHAFQSTLRTTDLGTTIGQLDWPELVVTVQLGDHGEAVRAAQTLVPGELTVDGSFGPQTDAAVRDYQQMFAPPVDGIVGPLTWYALTLRIFD